MTTDKAQLRKLLENATKGPWEKRGPMQIFANYLPNMNMPADRVAVTVNWRDAALISAAVNSLPALLDELDRLRAALKPFATLGGMLTGPFAPVLFPDDRPVGMGGAWSENGEPRTVTFGDLRRARLALEPKP